MRPQPFASRFFLLFVLTMTILTSLFPRHNCFFGSFVSEATEIVATNEWTLLGENDTVDAGMHIRINMETGEKWVKLLDDIDNFDDSNTNGGGGKVKAEEDSSSASSRVNSVALLANGEQQQQQQVDNDGHDEEDVDAQYDFEMMYRTLSRLPDDEKERMQLPEQVVPRHLSSPEARQHFEEQMKKIWQARQAELAALEQDGLLANLPQLLKDRIQQLREYLLLSDPYKNNEQGGGNENGSDNDNDNDVDVVWILSDLEYHLADVDMARDFYTLGGWPLLVSLLSLSDDNAHHTTTTTTTTMNHTTTTESSALLLAKKNKVHAIQAHAAWAMGTAVKNSAEFGHYAVEPISIVLAIDISGGDPLQTKAAVATTTTTTALDVLLEQIQALDLTTAQQFKASEQRLLKYLYALGSFLRGNRRAQHHFVMATQKKTKKKNTGGLDQVLAVTVQGLTKDPTAARIKVIHRLLALADDIISDIRLHGSSSSSNNNSPELNNDATTDSDAMIVKAFSTDTWCQEVRRVIQHEAAAAAAATTTTSTPTALQETALKAVRTMLPYCLEWKQTRKKGLPLFSKRPKSSILQDSLEQLKSTMLVGNDKRNNNDDMDPDVRGERIQLIEELLQQLLA